MKMKRVTAICTLATLATCISVFAQNPQDNAHRVKPQLWEFHTQGGGDNAFFVSSEMGFGDKVVKGAPYSAQATTESVQTLSDGNRIVNNSTATVYRDSQGRTRRDQTMSGIGPWTTDGAPKQMIFINDTVAGVHYFLDPSAHTAQRLPLHLPAQAGDSSSKSSISTTKVTVISGDSPMPPPPAPMPGPGVGYVIASGGKSLGTPKTESLGKQTIEGVEAEGTRTTFTIEAGAIGNDMPINIVSERWYSADLQTVVMSRHSDPRHGETTFRLTNINRSEPDASLFVVPSDYTVKDGPPGPPHGQGVMRFKKNINNQ